MRCVTRCKSGNGDRPVPYAITWNERQLLASLTTILKTFPQEYLQNKKAVPVIEDLLSSDKAEWHCHT
jgi:hypothetical protein